MRITKEVDLLGDIFTVADLMKALKYARPDLDLCIQSTDGPFAIKYFEGEPGEDEQPEYTEWIEIYEQ